MNTTTESPDVTSTEVRRRRRHAIGMIIGGSAAVALFALFGTAWPGAPETTVASAPVQPVDQATAPPLRVQDVDDSDDEAQQAENNAIQSMIQSEQQAQEQNDQAEQQAMQDQLQAQQDEQQANQ
jgi:hypothetical protein